VPEQNKQHRRTVFEISKIFCGASCVVQTSGDVHPRRSAVSAKVARQFGVGTGTVQRIEQEMTGPFADAAA
jgi:hypothetical protein